MREMWEMRERGAGAPPPRQSKTPSLKKQNKTKQAKQVSDALLKLAVPGAGFIADLGIYI